MPGYGAEERALFEDDATKLYEEICQRGGIAASDYRIAEDGELRQAFDLLVEMGLISYDGEQEGWVADDPMGVQSRVVSPLSQQAAKLLSESSQWSSAFSNLAATWRRSPQAAVRGPFTYLRDAAIDAFLSQLLAECEEEMLTAQPQAGRDPRALAKAALRDIELLERGATMRTLYQHSARRSSVTHKYVAAVSARGAEVRTLDEFFNRMIVVDRRVAVIPNAEEFGVAVAIRRSITMIRLKNSSRVRTSAPRAVTAATYRWVTVLRRALCWYMIRMRTPRSSAALSRRVAASMVAPSRRPWGCAVSSSSSASATLETRNAEIASGPRSSV